MLQQVITPVLDRRLATTEEDRGWREAEVAHDISCPGICFGVPSLGVVGGFSTIPRLSLWSSSGPLGSQQQEDTSPQPPHGSQPECPSLFLLGPYCWANTGLDTSHGKDRQKGFPSHCKPPRDQKRLKLRFFGNVMSVKMNLNSRKRRQALFSHSLCGAAHSPCPHEGRTGGRLWAWAMSKSGSY